MKRKTRSKTRIDKRGGYRESLIVTTDQTGYSGPPPRSRFVTRLPLLLARHLWAWPLAGALVISIAGFWVRSRVESTTRAELGTRLQTLLNADVAALHLWFTQKELDAESFAAEPHIREAIEALATVPLEAAQGTLLDAPQAKDLQRFLEPLLEPKRYLDYVIVSPDRRIIASPHRFQVGRPAPPAYDLFVERALAGQLAVSRPFAREATPSQRAEGPTMFVAAPVKSTNGVVIAAIGLRMKPEEEFSRIFSVARMGLTGEAYAFDRRGVMLTASRFNYELRTLGLITNSPDSTTILNLRLLDPERDLQQSGPLGSRRGLKLTRMATDATRGNYGCDVQGYRNYRGMMVVGAWQWLPNYGMGVATEVSLDEAFQTLYDLRVLFLVLFLLLVLSGGIIFAFTLLVERLQGAARKSAVAAKRLGQYVLVQEIGRGANGMVYRARHALLRRPVAIKLLSPELTNEATVARFEQEVQLTSQLTHPNTVAVYDYGRTPEGLFYYAMEYLSGIDLDQLIRKFGAQPEGRVIHILRQICGSLAEAHRIGLIHRDIKPANIILTRRGGVCDLVKVLDFGLAKPLHLRPSDTTFAKAVVGTPHFMSPEAVEKPESVDARSDLYSVGAIGYWLLTGQTLFDTEKVEALLAQQVKEVPQSPSDRLGKPAAADLEHLIMQCLEKSPERRPPSAEALDEALSRCASTGSWTSADAELWWKSNVTTMEAATTPTMPEKTLVIAPRAEG